MNTEQMGEFLKALRKSKGYSQQEIADTFHVSNKTVSKWETGRGIPEMTTLLALADFYDVTVDEILRGTKGKVVQTNKEGHIPFFINQFHKSLTNVVYISLFISTIGLVMLFLFSYITNKPVVGGLVSIVFYLTALFFALLELIKLSSNIKAIEEEPSKKQIIVRVFNWTFIITSVNLLLLIYSAFYVSQSDILDINGVPIFLFFVNLVVGPTALFCFIATQLYIVIRLLSAKKQQMQPISKKHLGIALIVGFAFIMPIVYQTLFPQDDPRVVISIYAKDSNQSDRYEELRFIYLMKQYEKTGIVDEELVYDYTDYGGIRYLDSNQEFAWINPTTYQDMMDRYVYNITITDEVATGYWMASDDPSFIQLMYYLSNFILSIAIGTTVMIVVNIIKSATIKKASSSNQ